MDSPIKECQCYSCVDCHIRESALLRCLDEDERTPPLMDTIEEIQVPMDEEERELALQFEWSDAAVELAAVKSMFTPHRERYRNCMFLSDNPSGMIPFNDDYMVYLVYCERLSPEGIHHLSGYVEFKSAYVPRTCRELLGGEGVILIKRSSDSFSWNQQEAIAYTLGEHEGQVGGPYEHGTPRQQGRKSSR